MPFGIYSGAGVLFGASGGVTEAAVRTLMVEKNAKALRDLEFVGFRGMEGIKHANVMVGDTEVKIAVVSGLANAEKVIHAMQNGEMNFDFVEVMACPGGCISGAGQPVSSTADKAKRAAGIYKSDKVAQFKRSDENPMMETIYNNIIKDKAHHLLHTTYKKR